MKNNIMKKYDDRKDLLSEGVTLICYISRFS